MPLAHSKKSVWKFAMEEMGTLDVFTDITLYKASTPTEEEMLHTGPMCICSENAMRLRICQQALTFVTYVHVITFTHLNTEDENLRIASRMVWFDQPRPPDSSKTAPVKIGPSS
ncbi:hypothetical protein STEG23_030540 [Scotinomys teguina]